MKPLRRTFVFFLLCIFIATGSFAQTVKEAHTEVSLITEAKAVKPGESFWVALRMRMDDGWHVYWRNPGDSGLPPVVKWTLPQGWTAGEIQWPVPALIAAPPLAAYGYEKEVLFLVSIQTSPQTPIGSSIEFEADVSWLACQVDCIPGKAIFKQKISISPQSEIDPIESQTFDQARGRLPQTQSPWEIKIVATGTIWRMHFSGAPPPKTAQFFSERSDLINHAAQQQMRPDPDDFTLEIPISNLLPGIPEHIEGILKTDETAFFIKAPVIKSQVPIADRPLPLVLACLFAFLGGLILNIMPCVLPVLSLKIMSLAAHQYSRKESMKHGLVFALGVLISFWLLAGILFLIKNTGAGVGWGFQFQSSWFVAAMATLFFIFALNLFGFFEIGTQLTRLGAIAQSSKGLKASFLNGFLATIVATPCTAPFMGTAVAYALSQPVWMALAVFSFLGAGMAFPTVILSAFPQLLRFLPKSGPWMNTLKRLLGVMMLLSALWMIWVLVLQLNISRVEKNISWHNYSPQLLEEIKKDGKDYFLDFTAAWCLTCQVNDRIVLKHPKVVEKFKEKNIVLVKADWTRYDPAITQALAGYGRNSIPLYVFYSSQSGEEKVLGETITVQGLID